MTRQLVIGERVRVVASDHDATRSMFLKALRGRTGVIVPTGFDFMTAETYRVLLDGTEPTALRDYCIAREYLAPIAVALIPHPREYSGYHEHELTDVVAIARQLRAYEEGWAAALYAVFGGRDDRDISRTMRVTNLYQTTYARLRDFLQHDEGVPFILAARFALHWTRHELRRS